ncbi:MAG: relaxase/mobilization nuclease domain-containing protein, partial [Sphingobacterium sp.]
MVAKFHQTQNIVRLLIYNEKKVEIGKADCIYAGNLILNASELNLQLKKDFLKLWSSLNENIHVNCVHISLSFHQNDQAKPTFNLPKISSKFMELIGFDDQPYLVYQHKDTCIPHVHIVSTNVQHDGKSLDTSYICQKKNIPAIDKLEKSFDLTPYAHQKNKPYLYEEPTQIIEYGTQPTKKSMEDVIHFFMKNYTFTNFEEWKSLLKIYNIKPTLLPVNERRTKPGLLYSILDMINNKSIGVPILAGELKGKPTYNTLNMLYNNNRLHQESLSLRVPMELTFLKAQDIETESELIDQLTSRGINPVLVQDP